MLPPQSRITCSTEELVALASFLGGEVLIGVPDPFPGWLAEEIEVAIHRARQNLIRRGYLGEQGGSTLMDAVVAALVKTVTDPEAAIMLTLREMPEGLLQENFYYRSPLTVHLHPDGKVCTLRELPSPGDVFDKVSRMWGIEDQTAADADSFLVPQSTIEALQKMDQIDELEASQMLESAGVEEASARSFARTLQAPRRNGALVALRSLQTAWQVRGVGILEGENGLWRLRSFRQQGTDWVECIPSSASELSEEIHAFLARFIPMEV